MVFGPNFNYRIYPSVRKNGDSYEALIVVENLWEKRLFTVNSKVPH